MRHPTVFRAPMILPLLAAIATQPALAQDVQYRTVTKLDMGAALNLAMRMAGASEVTETTSIKGKMMRTDTDKSSTIYDFERSRFIIINHTDKSYIAAPISQITAAFDAMTAGTTARTEAGQMKTTARDSSGNKADFTFRVRMDPTGERENVSGHDAQRVFATLETDVAVTPEGETKSTEAGTLAVLIDSWNATDGPAAAGVRNFQQSMSKQLRAQTVANARGLNAALAQNPQLGEAMKKAAVEQQKIDGMAVKTTMYFVVVPPTMKFDRDLALKPQDSGAGGAAKRALGGMLGGALRRGQPAEKPAAAEAKQATLMKATTEIRDVQTAPLPASLFEAPAGYREIPFTARAGK